MGCVPLQKDDLKSTSTQDEDNGLSHQNEKVDEAHDLKISGGLFLTEGKGDPYLFYEVIKTLGEGAYGQVFKVMNKKTKNIRAMKVINKLKACLDEDDENNLIKEINVLRSLDHPNILKIYEYYSTPRKLYIISELCNGGELFDRISKVKYFNEKVAAHILRQLLSAITFCHSNNVIHRDLKPENILIESENEKEEFFTIKVIDFGTSEIFRKNKLLDKKIGTPLYIAPEVLNNQYNEKCDLWSTGVILYILLCGSPPFYGSNDNEIYKKITSGKYSMKGVEWGEISTDAKDLIKNLLVKDYTSRYSANQALNHPWIKKMKEATDVKTMSKESINKIMGNFQSFSTNQKLQQAALAYIVHNLTKKEDLEEMRKAFVEFDTNGDGKLTKDELINGLLKVKTPTEAKAEVDRIMSMIDNDNNGYIEYEEFLSASLNKEKLLTDENLMQVFELFDKDKSGKVTAGEIKIILSGNAVVSDVVWNQIMKDIDCNGDGELSFKEFRDMMRSIVNKK